MLAIFLFGVDEFVHTLRGDQLLPSSVLRYSPAISIPINNGYLPLESLNGLYARTFAVPNPYAPDALKLRLGTPLEPNDRTARCVGVANNGDVTGF